MEAAIAQAHASAGLMISVGKELMHHGCEELIQVSSTGLSTELNSHMHY